MMTKESVTIDLGGLGEASGGADGMADGMAYGKANGEAIGMADGESYGWSGGAAMGGANFVRKFSVEDSVGVSSGGPFWAAFGDSEVFILNNGKDEPKNGQG